VNDDTLSTVTVGRAPFFPGLFSGRSRSPELVRRNAEQASFPCSQFCEKTGPGDLEPRKGIIYSLSNKDLANIIMIRDVFRKSSLSGKIALVLSTWFGTGLFPVAPGTCGTIAAIPVVLLCWKFSITYRILCLAIIIVTATWASDRSQAMLTLPDPPAIVIDEVAGFLLAVFFLPTSWSVICLGFIFFRLFDIIKPFPIKQAERMYGGIGIVMDDILAGLYAWAGVVITLHLWNLF